jgi:hypothetical protein
MKNELRVPGATQAVAGQLYAAALIERVTVRNEVRTLLGRREVEAGEERSLVRKKSRKHTGRLPPRQCDESTQQ